MKYLGNKPFDFHVGTKAYRDGWDAIFAPKEKRHCLNHANCDAADARGPTTHCHDVDCYSCTQPYEDEEPVPDTEPERTTFGRPFESLEQAIAFDHITAQDCLDTKEGDVVIPLVTIKFRSDGTPVVEKKQ